MVRYEENILLAFSRHSQGLPHGIARTTFSGPFTVAFS